MDGRGAPKEQEDLQILIRIPFIVSVFWTAKFSEKYLFCTTNPRRTIPSNGQGCSSFEDYWEQLEKRELDWSTFSKALHNNHRKLDRTTEVLLSRMDVSPYATAYRFGYGPAANAVAHIGHAVLLKLDIRHDFDSIIFSNIKKYAFPDEVFSEPIRTLFALLCTYKEVLPQGAPSSPVISNLILKRYGFFLNDKKIKVIRGGQRKIVTAYVINEKRNVSADYRRKIRQETMRNGGYKSVLFKMKM